MSIVLPVGMMTWLDHQTVIEDFSMNDLTLFLRSRSLSLAFNRTGRRFSTNLSSFRFKGKKIFYRPGSSDVYNIRRLLFCDLGDEEYFLPKELRPSLILDIGANTGISTILLAHQYPQAKIMCFEPIPENFSILRQNIEKHPNVEAFPMALGGSDGAMALQAPENEKDFVGYSMNSMGTSDVRTRINAPMRSLKSFLDEMKCDRVDMIKIDAEGSEHDILTNMSREMLSKTEWIVGETHGIKDFILFDYLSPHFCLGIKKIPWQRLTRFQACNKSVLERVFKGSGRKAMMKQELEDQISYFREDAKKAP